MPLKAEGSISFFDFFESCVAGDVEDLVGVEVLEPFVFLEVCGQVVNGNPEQNAKDDAADDVFSDSFFFVA